MLSKKNRQNVPKHGLLEEYGRINHILAAISKRLTFSLSEQPHVVVVVDYPTISDDCGHGERPWSPRANSPEPGPEVVERQRVAKE